MAEANCPSTALPNQIAGQSLLLARCNVGIADDEQECELELLEGGCEPVGTIDTSEPRF